MVKNMLMQLDWDQPPAHTARQVLQLARQLEATLTLLIIRQQLDELMESDREAFVLATLTQLEATRQILQSEAQALGVNLIVEIAASGHPIDTLLAFGTEQHFDLLVVCKPHEHHRLRDAISGEPWKQITTRSTLPVLVMPS
ncbi:universal stress protein [Chromobacterium haemolyticum]|uniref:Universal stress protein n=1 Tax=Chromobacterium fluminis TaxID=3044269 RepID=A0ABX0LFX7_9NEIS|nr:universal stress protein [Chromobacterium haemolyticum]NHR08459.1 universal stress protein [Chromobacterium haemolyticum]